jgi:hypothetical protein
MTCDEGTCHDVRRRVIVSVIVCHVANSVGASIVRDRAISSKMGRLFAVWTMVALLIVSPDIVLHFAFHLKHCIE